MSDTSGGIRFDLDIRGMSCASCVSSVERALSGVPGVRRADVNFATHTASVATAEGVVASALLKAVADAGYEAAPRSVEPKKPYRDNAGMRLAIAVALTVPALLVSMLWPMRPDWANWLLLMLATPVVFLCGTEFFTGAYKAARHATTGMDTLIATGAGAAWALSTYSLLTHSDAIYFETGSTIVTLILFGRWLESRAKRSMSNAIEKLLDLSPKTAHLLGCDGTEREVTAESLTVGDLVRIKPGEKAPVDGQVVDGESYFDESLLTGESVPIARRAGDNISGGSVNGSGSVEYRVTRMWSDSRPAQLAKLVEQAQGSKVPIQSLADKISSIFVPIVIAVAVITFLVRWLGLHDPVSSAMLPAVAVLVVACPCALGLATPTAIVVGVGRAANLGILIRDGAAIQRAGSIRTVLLDKTGTITEGKPSVFASWFADGVNSNRAIQLAGSLEAHSEHPLGRAITEYMNAQSIAPLPVTGFAASAGRGVAGTVEGETVLVGSAKFVCEDPDAPANDWEQNAATVVWVSQSGKTVGAFAIGDNIREGATEALRDLKSLGLEPIMLTGDRQTVAKVVAANLGIERYVAEVLPEHKAEVVAEYKQQGSVAMVGDGINDAPALAAADLGIAMGAGSDIAKETADIILLQNDLSKVAQAVKLSRRTMSTINANLIWAFGYNALAIPIAVAGRLNPMIAAGAMALSSVSVVLNSLRLRKAN